MTSTRTAWTRLLCGSPNFKPQQIANCIRGLDWNQNHRSPNVATKRNAHFTYTPDPTDTSKGKFEHNGV